MLTLSCVSVNVHCIILRCSFHHVHERIPFPSSSSAYSARTYDSSRGVSQRSEHVFEDSRSCHSRISKALNSQRLSWILKGSQGFQLLIVYRSGVLLNPRRASHCQEHFCQRAISLMFSFRKYRIQCVMSYIIYVLLVLVSRKRMQN